jgi:hypothetical protein
MSLPMFVLTRFLALASATGALERPTEASHSSFEPLPDSLFHPNRLLKND